MGQTIVIVNDLRIAIELLDKKSAIFSDRPAFTFGGSMYALSCRVPSLLLTFFFRSRCGWENALPMLRYGERFRMLRKTLHQTIGSNSAMRRYYDQEETSVRRFLYKTMRNPGDLSENVRKCVLSIFIPHSILLYLQRDRRAHLVHLTWLSYRASEARSDGATRRRCAH